MVSQTPASLLPHAVGVRKPGCSVDPKQSPPWVFSFLFIIPAEHGPHGRMVPAEHGPHGRQHHKFWMGEGESSDEEGEDITDDESFGGNPSP